MQVSHKVVSSYHTRSIGRLPTAVAVTHPVTCPPKMLVTWPFGFGTSWAGPRT